MYLMTAHIVAVQSPLVRWIAVHLDAEHSWPQPSFQGQRQGLANSVRCLVSWAMKWPPDIIVGTSVTRIPCTYFSPGRLKTDTIQ